MARRGTGKRRIGDVHDLRGALVEGMSVRGMVLCLWIVLTLVSGGCSRPAGTVTELRRFPLDNLEGVITQSVVMLDKDMSSDGNGSLRIAASGPTTVRLFEVNDLDVDDARLFYQAKLRTENVDGRVYLEMRCVFSGKGEFFSRGLQSPISGTTDWATEEAVFILKKGEKPDTIKLNLVIDGKGTAWIDDVRLLKGPLG